MSINTAALNSVAVFILNRHDTGASAGNRRAAADVPGLQNPKRTTASASIMILPDARFQPRRTKTPRPSLFHGPANRQDG